jgi:glutamate-5-semialdehyde dehydrogenase
MGNEGLRELAIRAQAAARKLALLPGAAKDAALLAAADRLEARRAELLEANAADVSRAEVTGAAPREVDRLRLDDGRVAAMADGLRSLAAIDDPVGEVVEGRVRPNGLIVERVRVPLGVVGIIYENRPNVTSDAAGICLKAGNAVLLRGSSAALSSNKAIAGVLRSALCSTGLPEDCVTLVEETSHEAAKEFVRLDGLVDCLIPRGGQELLAMVRREATVPYVIDGDGNCHVYVDKAADLDMARRIVVNAKTSRPSVCNAAESLLVHADVAPVFLPAVAADLGAAGVELVGDARSRQIVPAIGPASEEDFATEFLALKMSVAVADDLGDAIDLVNRYSSGHSEAIVTEDLSAARRFVSEVDAAAVLVNASTRLVDGGELGLGAEVGISTQKLHARGPMGARELTCVKYVIRGEGQLRQ